MSQQSQTISIPADISLAPGTLLTLQNGQIVRIEQGSSPVSVLQPNLQKLTFLQSVTSDQTELSCFDDASDILDNNEAKRKPGRPKNSQVKFEKPIDKGPYDCNVCGAVFQNWNNFKKHTKTHELDRKHRCLECGSSFNMEKNFKLHMASHLPSDNLKCPECGKSFTRLASFKSHLIIHEEEDNIICTECGDEFATEKLLLNHQLLKHRGLDPKLKNLQKHKENNFLNSNISDVEENDTKAYNCKTCVKSFSTFKELREHQIKHKKLKSSLELLRKRSKVAIREGNLTCKFCNKKFVKPSQVIRHERIHTGVRPYKCLECGKAFTQKQSLESHSLKHTGQKPYACSFCSMKFSQRGNLRAHIVRLHNIEDEDKFRCSHCTCSFRKLGSLNAHTSRYHPEVENDSQQLLSTGENQ